MQQKNKLLRLKEIISRMDSLLVAYSGGVDSTLLLKVASLVLPQNKILAVTASSPTYPADELCLAKENARRLGIRHKIIKTYELDDKEFRSNPSNRCYFCKKELFLRLKKLAERFRLKYVVDASSISDRNDFRPGSLAKKELHIRSPLEEAGFTKGDIRKLSRKLKLPTWDKPSLACLASRIPYGNKISPGVLTQIDRAEDYLRTLGFIQVRVRHYNDLCRIEVVKSQIPLLLKKRIQIVDKLKKIGYNYVTMDLEGFRTGSMNEVILKSRKGMKR